MSVRDTGWATRGPNFQGKHFSERTVGAFTMTAWPGEGWEIETLEPSGDGFADTAVISSGSDSQDNKRAAEDALRQLCRDTLTALGDGE